MENELVCFAYRFGYGATYNRNIKCVRTENFMRLRSNIFLEKSCFYLFGRDASASKIQNPNSVFLSENLVTKDNSSNYSQKNSVNPVATLIRYMKNMYGALRRNLGESNEAMPKDRVSFREVDKPVPVYKRYTGFFYPRLRARKAPR